MWGLLFVFEKRTQEKTTALLRTIGRSPQTPSRKGGFGNKRRTKKKQGEPLEEKHRKKPEKHPSKESHSEDFGAVGEVVDQTIDRRNRPWYKYKTPSQTGTVDLFETLGSNQKGMSSRTIPSRKEGLSEFQTFSFFSGSKAREPFLDGDPNWRRYLSNFQLLDTTLSFRDLLGSGDFLSMIRETDDTSDYSEYGEMEFGSIEHAFQAAKYAFASTTGGSGVNAWRAAASLSTLVKGENVTGAQAKGMGGKKGFVAANCSLKVERWGSIRVPVMRSLVKQRVSKDCKYARILTSLVDRGNPVVHFERGSKSRPPFWGQVRLRDGEICGDNMLGRLMLEAL